MGFFQTLNDYMFNPIQSVVKPVAQGLGYWKDDSNAIRNEQMQREFAQNGIRWRVDDAKKAGIHPLAALGTSTTPFQPAYSDNVPDSLRNMGQDIGRSITSTLTGKERIDRRIAQISITRGELENELLRSQIQKEKQTGPSLPSIGGGDPTINTNDRVQVNPAQQVVTEAGSNAKEAGAHPTYTFSMFEDGFIGVAPTQNQKQLMEDDLHLESVWKFNIAKSAVKPQKKYWHPKAIDYQWNYARFGWSPVFAKSKTNMSNRDWQGLTNKTREHEKLFKSGGR